MDRRRPQPRPGQDLGVGEQRLRRAVERDRAIAKHHGAIRVFGHQPHVVGDEHHRRAPVGEGAKQVHQIAGLLTVLSERRLVEHHDIGLAHHHRRHRKTAFLAVTQHVGAGIAPFKQAHGPQAIQRAPLHFVLRQTQRPQPVGDLVIHRGADELLLGDLEDVRHAPGQVRKPVFRRGIAVHQDDAGIRRGDSVEERRQGRLARTVLAH